MQTFDKKVAVITGAGSGIGRCLAQRLDAAGCKLALCDVNQQGLAETAASLKQTPLCEIFDVADRSAMEQFAVQVKEHFNTVDMVFNNAGVSVCQSAENTTYEDFEWLMGINFWGVVYGCKSFLAELKRRPEAAIVNVSSIYGIVSASTQSSYNASKFAVRGYSESLRQELRDTGVNVLSVHPGGIRTNIVKSARFYTGPVGFANHADAIDSFSKLTRTTPEKAADIILAAVRDKKARVLVGPDAKLIDRIQRNFPESYPAVVEKVMTGLKRFASK